jgi:prepilin-type N-terminal cleavage/methylation domain-containing protein
VKDLLKNSLGYTLFELIAVIAVLSVVAAIGAIFIRPVQGANPAREVSRFQADLLAAQWLGISRGQRLEVRVNTSGYTVHACGDSCLLAQGASGPLAHTLAPGATLVSSMGASPQTLYVDTLGRPTNTSAPGDLLAQTLTFTVSAEGRSATLALAPLTGFTTR